ncbi:uncharacterized protein JCM6883_001350 [Sporobolomyces salmoneus]|uniref:uncharacterized protein n=1 Tax=Sporobolomyces salmoneus TaxID=183962 RepID=UPI0031743B1F
MDHLSRLPPELLDALFELAASGSELTTGGISKYLLPSQERAIYRTITVKSSLRLSGLVRTLEAHPYKGLYTQELVWNRFKFVDAVATEGRQALLRYLPNLAEIQFDDYTDEAS